MKALVLDRANTFRYEERPIPQCLPGQLLVRMEAVCICGSDLHAIRGDQPLFSFPRVIGHEAAGRVAEVGEGVRGFSVGEQVCLMPCIPCGTCRACQRGRTNACARDVYKRQLLGADPRNVEDIWQTIYRGGFYRGGPVLTSALSGRCV